MFNQTGWLM